VGIRGPVALVVTFGPSTSPTFARAVAHARRSTFAIEELEPDRWEASYRLESDVQAFAAAARLVQMTSRWRATEIEVDGEPEQAWIVAAMLQCARNWLRIQGSCGEIFYGGRPWPRCLVCPLLDEKQAGLGGSRVIDTTAKPKTGGNYIEVVNLAGADERRPDGVSGPPARS
jgi:hypothetical protein